MQTVIVLSSSYENRILDQAVLGQLGLHHLDHVTLGEGWALEYPQTNIDIDLLRQKVKDLGLPLDVNLVKGKNRKKLVMVFDMDSTFIMQECIDELADYAGVKEAISEITELSMGGQLNFNDSLRARVRLLKGLDVSYLETTYRDKITLTPGARTVVATTNSFGVKSFIISGSHRFFTAKIREIVGLEGEYANDFDIENNQFTGLVNPPIIDAQGKLQILEKIVTDHNVTLDQVMAIGDGSNDVKMVRAAGVGLAFKGKEVLKNNAGVLVDHGDLRTVLVLQGYAEREFIHDEPS